MPLDISRRGFLQSGAVLATAFGFDLRPARAAARELKIARTTQTHSICPYCAVGCSVVIHTLGDKARNVKPAVVHIEGDPDSPINRGTLCSKGISLKEFVVNDRRLSRPLYRAPGAAEWTPLSWDEALTRMARLIKDTRDRGFEARLGGGDARGAGERGSRRGHRSLSALEQREHGCGGSGRRQVGDLVADGGADAGLSFVRERDELHGFSP